MKKIVWKSFVNLWGNTQKVYLILKRKNVTVNKGTIKIVWRCKRMLYLGKFFKKNLAGDKNHCRIREHCHCRGKYRGVAHSICNLKFDVPNEIPVVFRRSSNYDYQFIIKELANEFNGQFECFGKNKEIYKNIFCPNKKGSYKNQQRW